MRQFCVQKQDKKMKKGEGKKRGGDEKGDC